MQGSEFLFKVFANSISVGVRSAVKDPPPAPIETRSNMSIETARFQP
ncbi:MAG: Uncharacterised protein [Acidimicrobiaceae bacterium]|nr:MAG: Uncharacterised protein [Acidimicrobiaceae bacterium]